MAQQVAAAIEAGTGGAQKVVALKAQYVKWVRAGAAADDDDDDAAADAAAAAHAANKPAPEFYFEAALGIELVDALTVVPPPGKPKRAGPAELDIPFASPRDGPAGGKSLVSPGAARRRRGRKVSSPSRRGVAVGAVAVASSAPSPFPAPPH